MWTLFDEIVQETNELHLLDLCAVTVVASSGTVALAMEELSELANTTKTG